ncbi:hypothetical protein SAMN02910456_02267 [Ruminococcaceae bacterium YRB3002]|nr:hypothetical protein SAMN02910456_02267 [Ruminococcaceae bacterium YRB3002]
MTDLQTAMTTRHTVRKFTGEPLASDAREALEQRISELNEKYVLNMKLMSGGEKTVSLFGRMFLGGEGVREFILLAAPEREGVEEMLGFCSSDLMLFAQTLGINTWWIGGTYDRRQMLALAEGDIVAGIVAVGYGKTQGTPHKSKTPEQVSSYEGEAPEWFRRGVEAALLAPTAVNRQAFRIKGVGNKVKITYAGGPLSGVDLGIVKHHFAMGAGEDNFEWQDQ